MGHREPLTIMTLERPVSPSSPLPISKLFNFFPAPAYIQACFYAHMDFHSSLSLPPLSPPPSRIPRRPPWDSTTTPDELELSERSSFVEWRRDLAALQEDENVICTPFEKNLELWRQLWRVVERSDVLVSQWAMMTTILIREAEDFEADLHVVDDDDWWLISWRCKSAIRLVHSEINYWLMNVTWWLC